MKYIIFLFGLLAMCQLPAIGQNCSLEDEDFTGSTNNVPPTGWTRGPGANIGATVPPNPGLDPAVGFNAQGEFMISDEYICAGELCYDWHASSASSNFDVVISLSDGSSSWMPVDTIVTNGSGSPVGYINRCIDLSLFNLSPPFTHSIRWLMTRRASGTFYLENVCIDESSCNIVPTQLVFDSIPVLCRPANALFEVRVCATDSNGFVSDTFSGDITLSKSSGPGTLLGELIYPAVNGCAVISDLSTNVEGDYVLMANADGISGLSDTIEIVNTCPTEIDLRVMSYNLLNFPNGRNDCSANTNIPARWDTLEKIAHYYLPDVLMVCELQNQFGADQIINQSLNSNGFSNYAAANFVLDQSGQSSDLNNMFYYNADKLELYAQTEIITDLRDINKYTVFVKDVALTQGADTTFIDFYMAHLKAGQDPSDSLRRITSCNDLRAHLDARPERNSVLGGDLNLYTSSEQSYQVLLSGVNPLNDPIQTPGNWNNNFTFRQTHTQSTRASGTPSYDCGARGGCDSRFDFLLASDPILSGAQGISYEINTYEALGNNGTIYNQSVNDNANTTLVPDEILNALFFMSDHLPVVMEMQATLSAPTCQENLFVNGNPIPTGTYRASNSISSMGTVLSTDSVIFIAPTCITLQPSFEVELGGVLEIILEDCE